MFTVQVTSDPFQTQDLVLPDGTVVSLTLYFVPMQLCWVITNITYGTFILNGIRLTNSPNVLYQYKNQIPFGLACFSKSNREPSLQQDFSSGASQLFLLTKDEVNAYAGFLSGNT